MAENLEHTSFGGPGPDDPHEGDKAEPFQFRQPSGGSSDHRTAETVSTKIESAFVNGASGCKRPCVRDEYFSHNANAATWNGLPHNNGGIDLNRDPVYNKLAEEISYLTTLVLENKKSAEFHTNRYKDDRDFKNTGNKIQFNVNASALTALDEAYYALETGNLHRLETSLLRALKILEDRNKMVLIADISEMGWATVSAYQNFSVGANDIEDKKTRHAEGTARA
jgi:hypothetical protein